MNIRIGLAGLMLALCLWGSLASAADSLKAQTEPYPWSAALQVSGDWEMNLAGERSHFQSGMGFEAEFVLPISRKFALTASYFKRGLKANDTQYWDDTTYTVTGSTYSYQSSMYLLGIQYSHENFLGISFLDDFWYAKAGDATQDIDGRIYVTENATGDRRVVVPYDRESDFGVIIGVGFLWKVSHAIGVDVGFERILRIDRPANSPEETSLGMWQTAAVKAGVIFGVPRKK